MPIPAFFRSFCGYALGLSPKPIEWSAIVPPASLEEWLVRGVGECIHGSCLAVGRREAVSSKSLAKVIDKEKFNFRLYVFTPPGIHKVQMS